MSITFHLVQNRADQRDFFRFAYRVYRDDSNWVPHLWPQRRDYLEKKAAFFTYGEGEFWLAKEENKVVGTIGTAVDHSRNRSRNEQAGIFGFFEVMPDRYDVAREMWDFACDWSRRRGLTELQGPYSFSGNDENGFLVFGFDCMPSIMMGHQPPHYYQFAERYGFLKLHESLAYRYDFSKINFDVNNGPEIMFKIARRVLQRHDGQAIRTPKMKDWDAEVDRLHAVYNKSLAVLPEYSPIELAEFRSQAGGLKDIIDPELVFIAEMDDKTVGFGMGLPNVTEALRYANGLQYPWDYLRFALARRRIKSASFKIMAIDPDYWGYGLETVMILEMGRVLIRKGYTWVDASLTNEFNPQTNKLASRFGAYVYRRYREYRLKL